MKRAVYIILFLSFLCFYLQCDRNDIDPSKVVEPPEIAITYVNVTGPYELEIEFSLAIQKELLGNVSNYSIVDSSSLSLDIVKAVVVEVSGNRRVILETGKFTAGENYTLTVANLVSADGEEAQKDPIIYTFSGTDSNSLVTQTYTVGGVLSGLNGTVVLRLNSQYSKSLSGNGGFHFIEELAKGTGYSVTVSSHPSGGSCTVHDGTGTVSDWDVDTVLVTCMAGPSVSIVSNEHSFISTNTGALQTSKFVWSSTNTGYSYKVLINGTDCSTGTEFQSGVTSEGNNETVIPASSLNTGTNTLRVCLSDAAGNADSVTQTMHRDDTPPADPGVTLNNNTTIQTGTNDANVQVNITGAETGTAYEYTIESNGGGTPVTGNGDVTTADFDITGIDCSGLADGTLTVIFTLKDPAGNKGNSVTASVAKTP